MSPKEPTNLWFDNIETKTRLVMPDNSISSYYITVREYHQNVMRNRHEYERLQNRRQIDILRREGVMQGLQAEIDAFGPNRPPRQEGESMVDYLERLRAGI